MGLEYLAGGVAVVLVVIIVFIRRLTSTFSYFEKRGISGPKPAPIFGNWWGIWNKFQGDLDVANATKFGKVYGTFDGKTPNLIAAECSLVKAVLGKESGSFRNRRAQCVRNPLLQQSLLALSNNEKQTTNKSAPVFLVNENVRSLVPLFLKAAESLKQNLEENAKNTEGKVQLSKHVTGYLADSLALGIFGLDLKKSEEFRKPFAKLCGEAFSNKAPESALSLIPFLFPSLSSLDGFVMSNDGITFFSTLCQATINDRRIKETSRGSQSRDFLEVYLEAVEEERNTLSQKKSGVEEVPTLSDSRVIAECLAVALNTSVLTRNIITLSIHTLATKTDVQDKLFSEIAKYIEAENGVSYELIQGCKYLNMFVDEVARLYPSEFRLERICSDAMEVEKTKIDKGTVVSIPVYAIHHSEEHYPDPEEFKPERFSAENAAKRDPESYLPYGQIGANTGNLNVQFGVTAAKLAVAYLVKSLKFSTAEETQSPPKFVSGLTGVLRPQEVTVVVERRN